MGRAAARKTSDETNTGHTSELSLGYIDRRECTDGNNSNVPCSKKS